MSIAILLVTVLVIAGDRPVKSPDDYSNTFYHSPDERPGE